MMEASGSGGLGGQGLLGAPPAAQKKKPNYMSFTHTPHDTHHTHTTQHTHSCKCNPSISTSNADADITGGGIVQSNMNTPDGITAAKKLKNTHTTYCSQTSDDTNEIKGERDQHDTTNGTNVVRHFKDILPFHDRFLQQLGDRHCWILYRINFSDSPDQQFYTACDRTWTKEAGPQEIIRLNKIVYKLLQKAFQDFAPARPIFWRHRAEHPLSASRVWFSLRDRFRMHESKKEHPTKRVLQRQLTEKAKNITSQLYNKHTTQHNTLTRTLYNRHTAQLNTHARPKAPYTRHTAHNKARPRVLYTRHTAHKDTHKTRPHHYTHTTTAKVIPHEGIYRSQLQFKKRVQRFSDRPSDRVVGTHTHTQPQFPMPKRLFPPHGMKSKGKRVEKSDGVTNPIHPLEPPRPLPRGGGNLIKGHTKNNTMWVPHKTPKLGRPGKRAKLIRNPRKIEEPEPPGPIIIDARVYKKERLAPVHFIKCSRNPAHIKRKLSWWNLAIETHASKTRLSRRWSYILNRRQHRQPIDSQQPWHKRTDQVRTKRGEYLGTRIDYSWEGIHGYTTPLPTLPPDIIQGQLYNTRFTMIAQPNCTVAHLKTTLGEFFNKKVDSFYVTTKGSSMTEWERASSKTPIRMTPRLRGGMGPKRRSTRPPALDFLTELAEVRRLLHQNMASQSPQDLSMRTLADEGGQTVLAALQKLTQRTKTSTHPGHERMQETTNQANMQTINNTWTALRSIHDESTPCRAYSNSTPRLFCPQDCQHTKLIGEQCPNQIPAALRTGTDISTETGTGVVWDPTANYLIAKDTIPTNTLFSAFGGAAIIKEKSIPGAELRKTYSSIQNSQAEHKCQYTFRSGLSQDEVYWVIPQPDISTISGYKSTSGQGISAQLKKALKKRSPLFGLGHIAQHSCCTNTTCSTSVNARLGLILEASNDDNDDT